MNVLKVIRKKSGLNITVKYKTYLLLISLIVMKRIKVYLVFYM